MLKTVLALTLTLCGIVTVPALAARPEKPNVILIFIDDTGFGDVGFNGATGPRTPNLEPVLLKGIASSAPARGAPALPATFDALRPDTMRRASHWPEKPPNLIRTSPARGRDTFQDRLNLDRIIASVGRNRRLALQENDGPPITGDGPAMLLRHPAENLSIGVDNRMPVDAQSPPDPFTGTIAKPKVTVTR